MPPPLSILSKSQRSLNEGLRKRDFFTLLIGEEDFCDAPELREKGDETFLAFNNGGTGFS